MADGSRVAVVTGAASGIGRALAESLTERGYRLVLADLDADALAVAARDLDARAVVTDVSDPAAMERLGAAAPTASLVCLNAGVASTFTGPVWAAPPSEWARVLGVNLGGVVNGLRVFVPQLLQAGVPAGVLITASLAGLATWPGGGPYAASKHAVVAVAEQAAIALADTPIGITLFCPALVRTAMSDVGEPAAVVARRALAAVESGQFAVVPSEWGQAIRDRTERIISAKPPLVPSLGD